MIDKVTAETKILLVEKGKFLSNETKAAETFSNIFENSVNKLDINWDDVKFNDEPVPSTNPGDIAIQKLDNHPNVKSIRDNITFSDIFHFESVALDNILKEVTSRNSDNNDTFKYISIRCLKEVKDICRIILTQ